MQTGSSARRACVVLVVGLAMTSGLLPVAPARAEPHARAGDPPTGLTEPLHGDEAVDALGDALPEVAAAHDMTAAELEDELVADESLWVDEELRLFYVDPVASPDAIEAAAPGIAEAPPFPLSETFTLHSRPGSDRTIYLDFDGDVRTAGAWNSHPTYGSPTITSTAFDLTGNAAVFDDAERTMIQSAWQRMVEDYAPFDVDITTAEPPASAIVRSSGLDEQYGTRVVFAGTNPIQAQCGCGGIAYVDVFDVVGADYYHPAYVFQQGLGGTTTSAKLLAEAGSHEVGHNLSLNHDGLGNGTNIGAGNAAYYSGHGSWAPIMGNGYTRPITQWSSGEYTGASNSGQDDLAAIPANGLNLLVDDHGATNGTATAMTGTPVATSTGRIGTRADIDVFSFTAPGGLVTLDANPAPTSPNLDISMKLYDSGGGLIITVDPTSGTSTADVATGLGASHIANLSAGTYFVHVEGVGALNPASTGYSDYGSLGAYTVTAALGPCAVDDDLDDDSTATTRSLFAGQSTSGKRCADDDYVKIRGFSGASLTANLTANDDDLSLDMVSQAGAQLATISVPAGTTQPLVFPFTTNADHFLRVRGGSGTESRYSITTAMPACPPVDEYESGNVDDFPSFATTLTMPGTKHAISCSGDPNNGDFAKVTGVAGREITATLSYPQSAGSVQLFIMRSAVSNQTILAGTATANQIQLKYTPLVSGTYELWVQWQSGAVPYSLTATHAPEPLPVITSITPTSAEEGSTVTITGTGLAGVFDVDFTGAANAAFTKVSPTQLTTVVPVGAVDGPITITNGAGSAQHNFNVLGATWGTAGTVTRDGALTDVAQAIAPAPDGTVYVAWDEYESTDDVTIVRYAPDGGLDPSFGGGDGAVTFSQAILGHVDDMSVDSQNRLLIIGQWSTGNPFDPPSYQWGNRLFRLEADGDLDSTFSGDGRVDFGSIEGSTQGMAYDVRADASNRVLVSGDASVPVPGSYNSKLFLQRYTAAGSLDSSFGGGDGSVLTDLNSNNATTYSVGEIRLDASGRIWVFASHSHGSTPSEIALLRYTAAGALDSTYNSDGIARYQCPGSGRGFVYGGNVLADGRAVFAATCGTGTAQQGARSGRFDASGELDTTYGSAGTRPYLTTEDADRISFSLEVPVGLDGAVYLHGFHGQTDYVGRISPNGRIDPAYEREVPHDSGWSTTAALDQAGALYYGYTQSAAGKVTRIEPVTGEPPNDAPVAVDDSATVAEEDGTSTIDVLANDSDADADELTITAQTQGANGGTVDCVTSGDECEFTPDAGDTSDTFTYTISDGVASDTATVTVTIVPSTPPVVIDSFTPPSGPVGTAVTITGSGFTGATEVGFNGTSATTYTVDSATQITATVPDGATDGAIAVTTTWGTTESVDSFDVEDVVPLPMIDSLSRSSGTRGSSVVITGSGFTGTTEVSFNGAAATFTEDSDTELTVTVPTAATDGTFTVTTPGGSAESSAFDVRASVADFDGDGAGDVGVFRPSTGEWFLSGIGYHVFGQPDDVPVPADYDGDGTTDVAVFRPSTGEWFLSGIGYHVFGQPDDVPVPADYDGDGTTDVAVFRPSTGEWFLSGIGYHVFGQPDDVPVPADYDGDGTTDVAVFRPSTGEWFLSGIGYHVFGQPDDVPVPADYDGDGTTDVAVFRPSTGEWFLSGIGYHVFGQPDDVPVPADYDGDGTTDVAVFRPSTGEWFLSGIGYHVFGQPDDVPVPATAR